MELKRFHRRNRLQFVMLSCFVALTEPSLLHLQADDLNRYWNTEFGIPENDGFVYSMVTDGTNLIVGGNFSRIAGIAASSVAKWDGHSWSALGEGISGGVTSVALVGSTLYAGGFFSKAGGGEIYGIARWDGAAWSGLVGGITGGVRALAVDGTNLYVGGFFTVGSAANIAKWDGFAWSPLGSGISGDVFSLATANGCVYAGGRFLRAGQVGATNIAKWDGVEWSSLGQGFRMWDGPGPGGDHAVVRALAIQGTNLYAGGSFRLAGTVNATNIAKWDGHAWSPLGAGVSLLGSVYALAEAGNELYVGGFFSEAGLKRADNIAKWDGVEWSPLGSGLSPLTNGSGVSVFALARFGSDVFVGGAFASAGGRPCPSVALWQIPHSLQIGHSGKRIILSWPSTGTNLAVEATEDLIGWSVVDAPKSIDAGTCVISNDTFGEKLFYRLRGD